MPELPEVETVVRTLRPRVVGQTIKSVTLNRTDIIDPPGTDLPKLLFHRKIVSLTRRGKRIIVELGDGNRLYIHLGMTGRLTTADPNIPHLPHTHLTIDFVDYAEQIRFQDPRRFGGIWWLGTESSESGMGPEPLTLTSAGLLKQLSRTTRAIKSALLDQSVVAGLGNIYVDESVFRAGIHPLTPANELSREQVSALNRAIKFVLNKAIHYRGSTLRDYRDADGTPGGFQKQHTVYARTGQPCRKCKSKIERIVLGGRSTHFCPKCQPVNWQHVSPRVRRG